MYLTVLTGVNGIVQLITVAVLFIIVLVMTYFTTRFIGNYQKGHLSCTNIQIIDTMRLSQNKLIQIVRTGDKYFAIAVCKDTVTLLGEINGVILSQSRRKSPVRNLRIFSTDSEKKSRKISRKTGKDICTLERILRRMH